MKGSLKLCLLIALTLLLANRADASPMNEPPPAGPVVLNLNGTPIPHTYTMYTTPAFTATSTITNISFAFREDPSFLSLDDVTMKNVTTGNPVAVVNGGFESGPLGSPAPTGWTYLNIFGATFGGIVDDNNPHTGSNNYYDGAVQAYDAITQPISTIIGDQYTISFWLDDFSGLTTFSSLSTNGDVTDTGGNGVNLVVYAGALPTPATVPEPATYLVWGLALGCLVPLHFVRRRRAQVAA